MGREKQAGKIASDEITEGLGARNIHLAFI